MAEYLFAVQDQNGREAAYWKGTVDKVGDVAATVSGDTVRISNGDEVVATGKAPDPIGDEERVLTLHRWPADAKLSTPVSHPVTTD